MQDGGSTRLRVSCLGCGHVRVSPSDVTIRSCVNTDEWSYWFRCPSCHIRTSATTGRRAALDAIGAGSALVTWTVPAEVNERPDGPPITLVDLLELHLLLLEPDWIDQVS